MVKLTIRSICVDAEVWWTWDRLPGTCPGEKDPRAPHLRTAGGSPPPPPPHCSPSSARPPRRRGRGSRCRQPWNSRSSWCWCCCWESPGPCSAWCPPWCWGRCRETQCRCCTSRPDQSLLSPPSRHFWWEYFWTNHHYCFSWWGAEHSPRLDVSVSDGRFSTATEDLRVKVWETTGDAVAEFDHGGWLEDLALQHVVQRPGLVVVSDQQHLGPAATALDVGSDEAQNVVVPHQDGLKCERFIFTEKTFMIW